MSNRILWLHIGGPKTGSTSIQNYLKLNATELMKYGIMYASAGCDFREEIGSGNGITLLEALQSSGKNDEFVHEIIKSYFGSHDIAICSSERLGELTFNHWRKLIQSCERVGVQIRVLFYIRNAYSYLQSAYDQAIKRHGVWNEFFEWVELSNWDHIQTLKILTDIFPRNSLYVVHYDTNKRFLIDSFFHATQLSVETSAFIGSKQAIVNRSLTESERYYLKKINKICGDLYSKEISDRLIIANPNADHQPAVIQQATKNNLVQRYGEDVNWVNKNYFDGKNVVSIFNIENKLSELKHKRLKKQKDKALTYFDNRTIEMELIEWAINKLANAQQSSLEIISKRLLAIDWHNASKADIPHDFDPVAYLLNNIDVVLANIPPFKHYAEIGKDEIRSWKWEI
jgi:hypothetical protein